MDPRRYRGLPAFYRQCSIKCLEEEMKARRKSRAKSRVQNESVAMTLRRAARTSQERNAEHTIKLMTLLTDIKDGSTDAIREISKQYRAGSNIRSVDWIKTAELIAHTVTKAREIEILVENA